MTSMHIIRLLDDAGENCELLTENSPPERIDIHQLRMEEGTLVLFVPSQHVSILPVNLPTMNVSQLRQALPYALEENILTEPEKCHLAVDHLKDPRWVGAVENEKMQSWMALAKSTGATEIKIYPDIDALPLVDDTWVIAEDEHTARLRLPSGFGWSVPLAECQQFLELTVSQAKELPAKILIYTKNKPQPLILALPIEYCTDDFPLSSIDIQKGILLSQGLFRISRASNLKKGWMAAAGILVAVLVLQALHSIWEYQALSHDETQIDTEISELYHKVFPNAKDVNSPRTLLQRELDAANKQTANVSFLNCLIKFSGAVDKVQNVEVQSLTFRNNIMQVNLFLANFKQLEKLMVELRKSGLNVAQDSAVSRSKHLEARLSIKG